MKSTYQVKGTPGVVRETGCPLTEGKWMSLDSRCGLSHIQAAKGTAESSKVGNRRSGKHI
jgi:hypothetical protein